MISEAMKMIISSESPDSEDLNDQGYLFTLPKPCQLSRDLSVCDGLVWADPFQVYTISKRTGHDEGKIPSWHFWKLLTSSLREVNGATHRSIRGIINEPSKGRLLPTHATRLIARDAKKFTCQNKRTLTLTVLTLEPVSHMYC